MNDFERKQSILIVDDNPHNLRLITDTISGIGYELRVALSGKAALESAITQPPDIILLDINMPEMDGFEVCKRLKSNEELKSIPVLFISALAETEDKVKAFKAGGVDYITKPIQGEEVIARVKTHLAMCKYQADIIEKNTILQKAIDDLHDTQDQLVHAEKMASLGTLTAGVAHEINNPINYIKTSVHALSEDMRDMLKLLNIYDEYCPSCTNSDNQNQIISTKNEIDYKILIEEIPNLIKHIAIGIERTEEIVNSLRIYSRPEGDEKIPTNVHDVLDSTLIMIRNRYKKQATIKKEFSETPQILAQPGRLIQVFSNIICNAVDAIIEGPVEAEPLITISSSVEERENGEYVMVRVIDNGPGMESDIKDRIFDPFFTTKDVGKGVGLGMSISYSIIRDHLGVIEVESIPGIGTTVSVYLPVYQEPS